MHPKLAKHPPHASKQRNPRLTFIYTVLPQDFVELPRRHSWNRADGEPPLPNSIPTEANFDAAGQELERRQSGEEPSTSINAHEEAEDWDAARVQHARMQGAVYITGRSNLTPRQDSPWLRRSALDFLQILTPRECVITSSICLKPEKLSEDSKSRCLCPQSPELMDQ